MTLETFAVLLPWFAAGLLSGGHCAGMCGGIVGALSFSGAPKLSLHLAYNGGRLFSYALAGALAGAAGAASLALAAQEPLRLAILILAQLLLVGMGAYLMGAVWTLSWLEKAGGALWRRARPFSRRFLPARRPGQAFLLGTLWGWLPCGLVYTALVSALLSGSWTAGAARLFAFGLGTLPNLLLAAFLFQRARGTLQKPWLRALAGFSLIFWGVWGLYRALFTA
ncbi:MAG: sulfite exporter TauE/SafE family protein [Zoogloeaceae bacterium]|jgi:sulfite exporter TauE/SafE|nr:sulfite exporter TauE/SafE family protein [Zoogloeaceae bacterium]